jgi:flavin reductase (DIM6/NTAB) family NADH-FMN oxidoreductase RutF
MQTMAALYLLQHMQHRVVDINLCKRVSTHYAHTHTQDTLSNIEATGTFVVSIMSEWFVEAANHCCGDFPPDVDELALSGLTALPALHCKAPLIGESGVNMECKVSSST